MRGLRVSRALPVRAVIAVVITIGTAAACTVPADAAAQPEGATSSRASGGPAGFPESHLWTFGRGTVLGSRFPTPQPIHGLPPGQHVVGVAFDPSQVYIGAAATDLLLADGTVWALPDSKPRQVPGMSGITGLTANSTGFYALSGTGAVYWWHGKGSPAQVTGVAGVSSLVSGYALESDGTVWLLNRTSAAPVGVPATVTQVSANPCGGSAYALTSTGTVYAWGANNDGQLGDGAFTNSATPVLVHRVSSAAQVIGGCSDAYAIRKGTGSVMAWGLGSQGELGNGHRYLACLPVVVSRLSKVTSLTPGWSTTYAVRSNGTVWDWGFGLTGQLGYHPRGYSAVPRRVPGIGAPIAYVAGSDAVYTEQNYAVAVGRNGSLWGPWGGQIDLTPSHQITRVPPFKPTGKFWLNPFGGVGWGYAGAAYIAN